MNIKICYACINMVRTPALKRGPELESGALTTRPQMPLQVVPNEKFLHARAKRKLNQGTADGDTNKRKIGVVRASNPRQHSWAILEAYEDPTPHMIT